jgi:hypothetical protein
LSDIFNLLRGIRRGGCSIVELSEQGDSTLHPVLLIVLLLHQQGDVHDEVGRVTSGGQGTSTSRSLVDGASVAVPAIDFTHLGRLEPDVRHLSVEDLRMRLGQHIVLAAPSAAFQEETVDIGTILGSGLKVVLLRVAHDLEIEIDLINWDNMLSGIVLLDTCQETLCEEETREPESLRGTIIYPVLHELESLDEVENPRSERLQRWEGLLGPLSRYLIVKESISDGLKVLRHHDLSLDRLANVD